MQASHTGALDQLSPFELKEELIKYARDFTHGKTATRKFLNAGRGNPNWVATTPREAFFLLGQFGIEESKRIWDEPGIGIGGMPHQDGIADRFREFLGRFPDDPGAALLGKGVDYVANELDIDADDFVHELTDAIIGDNYPYPDRMLPCAERIVQRFLAKTMCDGRPPEGKLDLFAVEGGTAAMCYVFKSLMQNRILKHGDTIALGTPIFTPYLELPHLSDFQLRTVPIRQSSIDGIRHTWQYTEEEIKKLEDPKIKAFFVVNPSNPASFTTDNEARDRIVQLVKKRRPDLLILTDDVYGTFVEGFRSFAAELPHNTILVYSYSKHFGCTGWRLGVVGLHEDHVLDRMLEELPAADRSALRKRYESISTDPDRVKFIDRIVADSRDVALNHTAGLSLPQQVQMALFSLFDLLDEDDSYTKRCRAIVHERFSRLVKGLAVDLPDDQRRVGYYADLDLEVWARSAIGDDFADYVAAHHDPVELVIGLAKRFGTVLLNGSGFDGPPWSARVSLANLNADEYEAIGRHLREIAESAAAQWRSKRS
jgi:aspartate 4-decarboxylase